MIATQAEVFTRMHHYDHSIVNTKKNLKPHSQDAEKIGYHGGSYSSSFEYIIVHGGKNVKHENAMLMKEMLDGVVDNAKEPYIKDNQQGNFDFTENTNTFRNENYEQRAYHGSPHITEKYNQEQTLGDIAEQKLLEDERRFSKTIADFVSGKKFNKAVPVTNMPLVLMLIGEKSKTISIDPSVIKKVLVDKHSKNISAETFKLLPRAITDPLMIFKNVDSKGGCYPWRNKYCCRIKR